MVVSRLTLYRDRAENVRSAFGAASVVFGSVIGFLIADGLAEKDLSNGEVALLAIWLYSFAALGQNLLKTAENIVWHVPLRTNLLMLGLVSVGAGLIGFFQEVVPVDDKIWAGLIPAWLFATLFTAILERPSEKELVGADG
jgi:hypothetical protein